MIVLCNDKMTALLAPARVSKPMVDRYGLVEVVAEYDDAALLAVTDEAVEAASAWWREVARANIAVPFDREAIRDVGVANYLCDEFGISTERNVAAAIGEMAAEAGLDPVDLWDLVRRQRAGRGALMIGMDRDTARRWREAHTLAEYGELTAQWLEGRIPSQPGYMPNCGPDDETLPHVEVLAAVNRAGYVTDCSQPGEDVIGYDGARWRQRAAVTGFIQGDVLTSDIWQRTDLWGRASSAGLKGVAFKPLAVRGGGFEGIEVTQRSRKGFTWFGRARDLDELMPFHGGSRRLVRTMWSECFEVVLWDPAWGRNDRLWPVLAAWAAAFRPDEAGA